MDSLDDFLREYIQTYGFKTKLPSWEDDDNGNRIITLHKAIAVNLGYTNSKVFDSVWRVLCPQCRNTNDKLICTWCMGEGYIEPYDLMITFVRRSDRKWNVSIYSTKSEIDCGAIAKSFGGGGHKGAAGFQCDELPFGY